MSTRNHYLRNSIPYANSQAYAHRSRNNARLFPTFVSSELDDGDEELEASLLETDSTTTAEFKPRIGMSRDDRLRSYELEDTPSDTDISREDLRFSRILSPRDVETRQLAYFSLPDLLQFPVGLSQTKGGSQSLSRNKSPFPSPSYSVESVAMDLEQTEDDIFMLDDVPTEDVEDETESTSENDNSEDFVNMKVKVERKPYPTRAVKVTVSVQPPSEVDEDVMDELSLYEQFDDELLSATSADADFGSSESEVCSDSDLSEEESEDDVIDEEIEDEESVCSTASQDETPCEEDSNNSDECGSESGVEFDNSVSTKEFSKVTAKRSVALKKHERERKTENSEKGNAEPKDSTEVMLDLLEDAIDDSEKIKEKIVEEVTLAKLQEAEAIAIAEGEKLAAQVMETKNAVQSPLVKAKGLGGSVVAGVQNAVSGVSSAIDSVKEKIDGTEEQGKYLTQVLKSDVVDTKKELEESIAKIEKDARAAIKTGSVTVEKYTDNAMNQVKELDKRIHHEASNLATNISKSGETAVSDMKLLGSSIPPSVPSNSIVVANVMVHETPKSSQSPKSAVIVSSTSAVSNITPNIPTTTTSDINVKPQPEKVEVPSLNSSIITASSSQHASFAATSQISTTVPQNSPKSSNSKYPEKEEYLSVCAADSMDSSEDDEDTILRKEKTKAETEEERRAVELAKDKLMEDWKSTRRESIDELDDKFQHILEDMISEFSMDPVIPVLPKKLKEAVRVSDEGSNKSNSATSSIEKSSESGQDQMIEEELFEDKLHLPLPNREREDNRFLTRQQSVKSSSSSRMSQQSSLDSQQSHNSSPRSGDSRMSSKSTHLPNYSPAKVGDKPSPKASPSSNKLVTGKVTMSQSPKTKLGNKPLQSSTTSPSTKSLKVEGSMEQPLKPVSQKSTPNKTVKRTASNKSLKSTQGNSPSKVFPNKASVSPITSKPSVERKMSKEKIDREHSASKPNLAGEKTMTSPKSLKPVMTGNPDHNIGTPTSPKVDPSTKMLSPHSSPNNSKSVMDDTKDIVFVPTKSPSISQHSSLQTDQSLEEKDWNLNPVNDEYNDLPNFNSNPEGGPGDSDSERDEESPSQKRKWKNSTEIASTLSHYLHLIKTETVENSVTEIIPLLTQLLVISRKSKTEHSLPTMIATLSAVRVLCERITHVKLMSGEKALRNVDLSWLIRILCKLSADPESKLKPEASFTLAKLVKAAGPDLITRPIYFLLVMENEGYGHKRGSQGSKTKAAALDTLTYALLTFPKEDFDDLEEIARWACLVVMHPHRRVRQAALECISVLGSQIGSPDAAVSRFRGYIIQESETNYNRSDSDNSNAGTKSAIKTFDGKGIFDVSAITAISNRIRKRILPLPSPYGLVEYGVKVPTGQELVLILTRMQEEEEEEYEGSTSDDSVHSSTVGGGGHHHHSDGESESESIRMSDLEKSAKEEKAFGKTSKAHAKKHDSEEDDDVELITPDVAYILSGKGRVNKQDIVNLNDENINNAHEETQQDDKEKRKKALLRKKKQKKRHVERTYSEYEDDSPAED